MATFFGVVGFVVTGACTVAGAVTGVDFAADGAPGAGGAAGVGAAGAGDEATAAGFDGLRAVADVPGVAAGATVVLVARFVVADFGACFAFDAMCGGKGLVIGTLGGAVAALTGAGVPDAAGAVAPNASTMPTKAEVVSPAARNRPAAAGWRRARRTCEDAAAPFGQTRDALVERRVLRFHVIPRCGFPGECIGRLGLRALAAPNDDDRRQLVVLAERVVEQYLADHALGRQESPGSCPAPRR